MKRAFGSLADCLAHLKSEGPIADCVPPLPDYSAFEAAIDGTPDHRYRLTGEQMRTLLLSWSDVHPLRWIDEHTFIDFWCADERIILLWREADHFLCRRITWEEYCELRSHSKDDALRRLGLAEDRP